MKTTFYVLRMETSDPFSLNPIRTVLSIVYEGTSREDAERIYHQKNSFGRGGPQRYYYEIQRVVSDD